MSLRHQLEPGAPTPEQFDEAYWTTNRPIESAIAAGVPEVGLLDKRTRAAAKGVLEVLGTDILYEAERSMVAGKIVRRPMEVGEPIQLNKLPTGTILHYQREYLLSAPPDDSLSVLSPLVRLGGSAPIQPMQQSIKKPVIDGDELRSRFEEEVWLAIVLATPKGQRSFTVDRLKHSGNLGPVEFIPLKFPLAHPSRVACTSEITDGAPGEPRYTRILERVVAATEITSFTDYFETLLGRLATSGPTKKSDSQFKADRVKHP